MRRSTGAAGLVVALAIGCGAPAPSPPASAPAGQTPAAGTEAPAPARASAAGSSSSAPDSPSPPPVGVEQPLPPRFVLVDDERAAAALLQAGKVDEAKSKLEGVLAAAPAYTQARYDLARAHARQGDFGRAARDLTQVFEENFIGMRAQAAEDPDLTSFWSSSDGLALSGRKDDYEARYRAVIARGVRVLARNGSFISDAVASFLAVGVYDAQTKRFVATAPLLPHTTHAFAPPNLPYAVVVTGSVKLSRRVRHGIAEPGQALETFTAFPFDTSGVPLARLDLGHVEPRVAFLSLADDRWELDLHTEGELAPPRIHDARYQLTFGKPLSRELLTSALTPPAGFDVFKAHVDLGDTHWGATLAAHDTRFVYKPPRSPDDAATLVWPTGETTPITARFRYREETARVLADATGEHALLLWDTEIRECDHHLIPGRYKITLVTRSTGAVTVVDAEQGPTVAAFDGAGALYFQREHFITRLDLATGAETRLPSVFLLAEEIHDDPSCGL